MNKQALLIVLLFFSLSFWRCGSESDYDVPAQDSIFRKFLENNQIEYAGGLARIHGLYKVTYPYQGSRTITAKQGDTVFMSYSGYTFAQTPSTFGQGSIFTTNIKADAEAAGWSISSPVIDLTPASFVQGSGQVIRGIDLGVEGSAEGDTLRLYLNADLAYGDKVIGFIPAGTPVVFKIYIEEVKKRQ